MLHLNAWEWPWEGLWPLRKGAHRARSGGGRPGVAESAHGKPGPNGMAGRHGSFEQAQGSPNAGRAPGGAGVCGYITDGPSASLQRRLNGLRSHQKARWTFFPLAPYLATE